MSTSFNNIVNRAEQDALKEMIFKRAKERAEALNKEVQENYTSNMQHDIMDLARATLNPEKNPFSKIIEEKKEEDKETAKIDEKDRNIGFPPRKHDEINSRIAETNKYYKELSATKEILSTMDNAREELGKKSSFMGALNFLNSQATISLVRSKGQKFSAIA